MLFSFNHLSSSVKQYLLITANYWAFTLTDGALRMLILLYFHQLGYSPFELATLFIFYEVFGVITNLVGGWFGARLGLNKTMNIGLGLQVIALSMLLIPSDSLTVFWVMLTQALSGVAKDLNKMSAKSAIKLLVPKNARGKLFKWIALLTGSKNSLKGIGFFLGGFLLVKLEFRGAILLMAGLLLLVWIISLLSLKENLGKAKSNSKFSQLFSKSKSINLLSAARLFLFASRDVWFVVALPVYLVTNFDWSHTSVGAFLAVWIIGYGLVQSITPKLINLTGSSTAEASPNNKSVSFWGIALSVVPFIIALMMSLDFSTKLVLISGLLVFGIVFAINSAIHSFLIVDYASAQGVSMDVGFYYMANAMGRLFGTLLSGWLFQAYGIETCLVVSGCFVLIASFFAWLIEN